MFSLRATRSSFPGQTRAQSAPRQQQPIGDPGGVSVTPRRRRRGDGVTSETHGTRCLQEWNSCTDGVGPAAAGVASPSTSLNHTHPHTRTQTHTRTRTHTHIHTHTRVYSNYVMVGGLCELGGRVARLKQCVLVCVCLGAIMTEMSEMVEKMFAIKSKVSRTCSFLFI